MIICMDVDYRGDMAQAAGLLFDHWQATEPVKEYITTISPIEDYEPGSFYKRELPCLLALLQEVQEKISYIIIDGYVWLNEAEKSGLGAYLHHTYDESIPVIGVAKSPFGQKNNKVAEIYRGFSEKPLYVTCVGMELTQAASYIQSMHGDYRLPSLLKRVDQLCRS